MALYVDAREMDGDTWFRLWDTQTGSYATGDLRIGGIVVAIKGLLAEGGILASPDTSTVVFTWLDRAMERGTNDPSKKPVADADRSWRTPTGTEAAPGPLRTALRARDLSEQAVRAILDLRVAELTARLSPETRAFLERTFVLAELLRGNGTARPQADSDPSTAAAVDEIAREWTDVVTVERVDSASSQTTYLFRLR